MIVFMCSELSKEEVTTTGVMLSLVSLISKERIYAGSDLPGTDFLKKKLEPGNERSEGAKSRRPRQNGKVPEDYWK